MRSVVVDANVFLSLLTGRHEKQREVAAGLLQERQARERPRRRRVLVNAQ